jgi:hypothetical protein
MSTIRRSSLKGTFTLSDFGLLMQWHCDVNLEGLFPKVDDEHWTCNSKWFSRGESVNDLCFYLKDGATVHVMIIIPRQRLRVAYVYSYGPFPVSLSLLPASDNPSPRLSVHKKEHARWYMKPGHNQFDSSLQQVTRF